jgi:nucleotide-binding universal stress UspA family protein
MTGDHAHDSGASGAGGFLRVLVAYDGSQRAEDALALALRLREPHAGSLMLACVRGRHRPWDRTEGAFPDQSAGGVDALLTEARHGVAPGIRVVTRDVVAASAARGLTEQAEADLADLLVVGSSRHAPLGAVATERTAGRLLHGAPCAVAIAPAGLRGDGPFRHVGVAYDGSPEAHVAVATAYALAARDGAAVTLVRVLPPVPVLNSSGPVEREERNAHLRAQDDLVALADAAPDGVNPRTVLLRGAPESQIKETCDGVVDLLITGSRGYGPLRSALLGSVSELLVEGAPHPVLVIPRTQARAEPDTAATRSRPAIAPA